MRRIAVGSGVRQGKWEEAGGRIEPGEKLIGENKDGESKGEQKEQEEQEEEEEHLMLLTSRGEIWLQGKGPAIGEACNSSGTCSCATLI